MIRFKNSTIVLLTSMVGVKDVQTNVDAKTVVVEAEESVSPQLMLEKLQKVKMIFSYQELVYFVSYRFCSLSSGAALVGKVWSLLSIIHAGNSHFWVESSFSIF